jgi:hypothetical protein
MVLLLSWDADGFRSGRLASLEWDASIMDRGIYAAVKPTMEAMRIDAIISLLNLRRYLDL